MPSSCPPHQRESFESQGDCDRVLPTHMTRECVPLTRASGSPFNHLRLSSVGLSDDVSSGLCYGVLPCLHTFSESSPFLGPGTHTPLLGPGSGKDGVERWWTGSGNVATPNRRETTQTLSGLTGSLPCPHERGPSFPPAGGRSMGSPLQSSTFGVSSRQEYPFLGQKG